MAKSKVVRSYLLPPRGSEMKKMFPRMRVKVQVFEDGAGTIESNLKNPMPKKDSQEQLWTALFNVQMDTFEATILALACAGIDLDSPECLAGLTSALEAICNHD